MVACRIERADLRAWLHEPMPVILVVYDAAGDRASWLSVQGHFPLQPRLHPDQGSVQVTVRLPRANEVNGAAMRFFARYRDHFLAPMEGLRHDLEP